ncbi:MAG: formate--tetrahydrofolate ligase [Gammaproteobacteria bacterium]|jgi:formate--tetrahydrofolate ligase
MDADITIARNAKLEKVMELAQDKLGIAPDDLEPYGHYKAKVSKQLVDSLKDKPDGKLVLVTAITPTPAGEGKTTTTIGLADAMNSIGKKTMVCVREPSLGPCFGMKGGGAGGGYAQVAPMDDINLHFTGDFHAISAAHNLLAALVDNHIHQGNDLGFDVRRPMWRRVVDMNDRALRNVVVGLGGVAGGYPRETGYDITVASEIMAILCLATSLQDLKERFSKIIVGYTRARKPILAGDLNAQGSMAVLMKDAVNPNLVQTLEQTPTFVHGGPFANIAHGCNSALATKTALKLADYVITEAGFGADLGAEKFLDIKCRLTGLRPSAVVLVATIRALKYSGGVELADLNNENVDALLKGCANVDRHVDNLRTHYGLPVVVAVNRFHSDTDAEIDALIKHMADQGVEAVMAEHFAKGGAKGAVELAEVVTRTVDGNPDPSLSFAYEDGDSLWEKLEKIAKKIYHASAVTATAAVRNKIRNFEKEGYGHFPVCVAKTQYSFSTDPALRGAPSGHTFNVRDVYVSAGAGFMVALSGDIMTMPGLPKVPAANSIDIDENGDIVGLS